MVRNEDCEFTGRLALDRAILENPLETMKGHFTRAGIGRLAY